jgi:hypothetical protein
MVQVEILETDGMERRWKTVSFIYTGCARMERLA